MPSYTIIPLSTSNTQNNESITFLSAKSDQQSTSTNDMLDILSRNRLDDELHYDITTKIKKDSDETAEATILTPKDVLNDFTQHTIDNFNNNESFDKFKIFDDANNSNLQQDRSKSTIYF